MLLFAEKLSVVPILTCCKDWIQKVLWHSYCKSNVFFFNVPNKPACFFSIALLKTQRASDTRKEVICLVKISRLAGKYVYRPKQLLEFLRGFWEMLYTMSFSRVLSKWEVLLLNSLEDGEEREEQRSYLWDERGRWMCVCVCTHTRTTKCTLSWQ